MKEATLNSRKKKIKGFGSLVFQMNDNCRQWPEKMLSLHPLARLCLKVLVIIWWQLINLSAGPVCRHHQHHILADLNWLHSQDSSVAWSQCFDCMQANCVWNENPISVPPLVWKPFKLKNLIVFKNQTILLLRWNPDLRVNFLKDPPDGAEYGQKWIIWKILKTNF